MEDCLLYSEPELYDVMFPSASESESVQDAARRRRIVDSEKFYIEQALAAQGRVLELGCGSGRLTVPIAQRGIEILGLELSPKMLDAARAKSASAGVKVALIAGDMRSFCLNSEFAAIFIPGNSLLHLLTDGDLKACLQQVKQHLAPAGRLVLDVSNPAALTLNGHSERTPVMHFPSPLGGMIRVEETSSYDSESQIRDLSWYFSTDKKRDFLTTEYRLRMIFPDELITMLGHAGFELQTRYGEFTLEPFVSSSPRQVCICAHKA